jgi:PAS domain S-box-containing protein
LEVNDAYCQMSGYSREELAQMSIPQVEDAETPEEVKRHIQRIVSRGSDRFESLHRRKDGSVFQVEVSVNFLPIEDGRLFCFLRDITERKKAEQVLLESEIRYRELFESMGNGVAVYEAVDDGADFVFSNMNKAGEKSGRVERTEIIGRRITEVFPRIKDIGLLDVFRRVWLTGEPEHHPVSFYKDERISQWVDNYVYKLPTGEIVAVYDDVTKRKEVEEKLYEYQKQLKSMASQVSKVQEQERRNIAVEMHDRISQHLAMAKVNVQIAAKSSTDAEVRDKLRKTAEEIGRVIEDAYSLMVELSNPVLYEIGLKAAIETLLKDRIRPEYNIEYVLEADDDDFKLDDVISVPLYQAVRELLRNVIKHSKANKVIVSIHKVGSNIQIAVRDNGVGFVTSIAGKSNKIKTGGFGLFSTKENVEHINGKLKIESEPGRGTVAIISAPFGFKTKPDLGGK